MRLLLALLPGAHSRVMSHKNLALFTLCVLFFSSTVSADVVILRQSVEFSYTWGNWFLDFIRGSSPLPNDVDIRKLWQTNWFTVEPYNHFKDFFFAAKGYLICLILGALFITLLLPIGIIFCCCRCCGRCGGRARAMDSRHAKCKRIFFTTTLLVLNTAILLCVVLALINNQLLHETYTNKNEKINSLAQMQNHSMAMSKYLKTVLEKVKMPADMSSYKPEMKNAILDSIDTFCNEFQQTEIGSTLLRQADYLANSVQHMNQLASNMDVYRQKQDEVKEAYEKALKEVRAFLAACPPEHSALCKELENMPNAPTTSVTKAMVDKLMEERQSYNAYSEPLKEFAKLSETIRNFAEKAKEQRQQQISDDADNLASSDSVSAVVTTVRSQLQSVNYCFQNMTEVLSGRKLIPVDREEKTFAELAGDWDSYRMYGFVAMCCFILLVVIFYYLGICFGICGERPFEDASVCNSGVGANLLMAGVGFTFSFVYILMLVVTCLFVYGGLTQTELCRHVTASNVTTEELQRVDHLFTVIAKQLRLAVDGQSKSDGSANMWHMQERISIMAPLLHGCAQERMRNMDFLRTTALLSVVKPTIPTNSANLLSLVETNYSAYYEKAERTELLVRDLATPVNAEVTSEISSYSNENNIPAYVYLQKVSTVHQPADIRTAMSRLLDWKNAANRVHNNLKGVQSIKAALQDLKKWSQIATRLDEHQPMSKPITTSMDRLKRKVVEVVLAPLLGDSSCHALGVTAQASFDTLCVNMLRPLNGFWYGLGVCLWLMLPALIFAVKLAGLYRKTEKYSSDYEEPDYMSYQGFYITPGENIPLERKSRGNNSQSGARGYISLKQQVHQERI